MSEVARIPIVKLYDALLVSIQVALSDRMVVQLKEDVCEAIGRLKPKGLIIDLSGIDLMDSYISRTIRDIGLVAKLMGVRTVVCGMDPMIAMTLIEMGLSLEGLETAMNLESAFQLLRRPVVKPGSSRSKIPGRS